MYFIFSSETQNILSWLFQDAGMTMRTVSDPFYWLQAGGPKEDTYCNMPYFSPLKKSAVPSLLAPAAIDILCTKFWGLG